MACVFASAPARAEEKKPRALEAVEAQAELIDKNAVPTPISQQKTLDLDLDNDGFKETTRVMGGDKPIHESLDANKDGKPDREIEFDLRGKKQAAHQDKNFDGKSDFWATYRKGVPWRYWSDKDFDGVVDYFQQFVQGRAVVLRERDRNNDGKIDSRALMVWGDQKIPGSVSSNGQVSYITVPGYLTRIRIEDSDFDGKIDLYKNREASKEQRDARIGKPFKQEPWSGEAEL